MALADGLRGCSSASEGPEEKTLGYALAAACAVSVGMHGTAAPLRCVLFRAALRSIAV